MNGSLHNFIYLIPSSGKPDIKIMKNWLGKRMILPFPLIENPFALDHSNQKKMEILIKEIGNVLNIGIL